MPEGDTIKKLASRLTPALLRQPLLHLAFEGRRSVSLPRQPVVSAIETHGKHLLLILDGRRILRVHLGLHGRLRAVAKAGPRPDHHRIKLIIETATERFVGARLKAVELFAVSQRTDHPTLSRLGPDLLVEPVPYDTILQRLRRLQRDRAAPDVLLDQRVAAGLGNVYQNELRYRFGIHPERLASDIEDEVWMALYAEGARQLSFNLHTRMRKTTFDATGRPLHGVPRHWVYGRAGERCLGCGEGRIVRSRSREDARPGFHCPKCQSLARRPDGDGY